MDFLARFDAEFAALLNHRAPTFRAVFAQLAERGKPPTIVETGCLRDRGNWTGDGQSTKLFELFVASCGGDVFSVDSSAAAVATARMACAPQANVALGDSVAFLAAFRASIDLLYLDSADEPENTLMELAAAMKNLRPGSIVLVDDTFMSGGKLTGKGTLVDAFMRRAGVKIIAEGYQRAWTM